MIEPNKPLPYTPVYDRQPKPRNLTELTAQQHAHVQLLAQHEATLDVSDTGTGKTRTALALARERNHAQTLVIAPVSTEAGWKNELKPTKLRLLKNPGEWEALLSGEPGVYWVGTEYFAQSMTQTKQPKTGIVTRTGRWFTQRAKVPKDTFVILDETHRSRNTRALLFRAISQLKTPYKHAMSATPQGNKFPGIYSTVRWLWPDYVPRSRKLWELQWCTTVRNTFADTGHSKGFDAVGERYPGVFLESLPCVVFREAYRTPVHTITVQTDLSEEQRRVYTTLLENAVAKLGDDYLVAPLPIVQQLRLRQVCLAEPHITEDGEVDFAPDAQSAKLDALAKIQKRHSSEPILCFTTSAKFAELAAKRLPDTVAWTGKLSKAKRSELLKNFTSGTIVAVWRAIAEGADGLQRNCATEVIFDYPPGEPMLVTQGEGRLNRTGQTAPQITRYVLEARDTIDPQSTEKIVAGKLDLRQTIGVDL